MSTNNNNKYDCILVLQMNKCRWFHLVQPRNPCASNPCKYEYYPRSNQHSFVLGLNGGQCVPAGAGFICNCPEAFTGNLCEAPGMSWRKLFFFSKLLNISFHSSNTLSTESLSKWWHMCSTRYNIILMPMSNRILWLLLRKSSHHDYTLQSMRSITLSKWWYMHTSRYLILLSMPIDIYWLLLRKSSDYNYSI